MATEPQVKYLRALARQRYLHKGDFPSERMYRRKKEIPFEIASGLIDLGIRRRIRYRA